MIINRDILPEMFRNIENMSIVGTIIFYNGRTREGWKYWLAVTSKIEERFIENSESMDQSEWR